MGRSAKQVVKHFNVFLVVYLLKFYIRDFALLSNFFFKKLRFSYIYRIFYLFGFGIWFWAVESLGSSHHAFESVLWTRDVGISRKILGSINPGTKKSRDFES